MAYSPISLIDFYLPTYLILFKSEKEVFVDGWMDRQVTSFIELTQSRIQPNNTGTQISLLHVFSFCFYWPNDQL